ncbi:hypothetical protein JTE90_009431 [Oedothorax gibbosus]|uniref:Uncharacterized protein n=1 Tax=Oedothorax gibbosus TaxID=931172 RepID=A0AAV6VSF5_9ARAC|nr:hypothetical protein JTE90_009431 [Oedothorax gibbosus]
MSLQQTLLLQHCGLKYESHLTSWMYRICWSTSRKTLASPCHSCGSPGNGCWLHLDRRTSSPPQGNIGCYSVEH